MNKKVEKTEYTNSVTFRRSVKFNKHAGFQGNAVFLEGLTVEGFCKIHGDLTINGKVIELNSASFSKRNTFWNRLIFLFTGK